MREKQVMLEIKQETKTVETQVKIETISLSPEELNKLIADYILEKTGRIVKTVEIRSRATEPFAAVFLEYQKLEGCVIELYSND